MPASTRETLLGRYHYDPLDRLVDCAPFDQESIQPYYCKTHLATEIQGTVQRTIVQHEEQLLAQQQRGGGKVAATLLATDQQRSVLNVLDTNQPHRLAYTPYGHRPMENGLLSLLGFNGERPDPVTGHYHLGNGYRQFNPELMRFNNPDSWSPFGKGGLNAYAYCEGEPVLRIDPDGHAAIFLRSIARKFGIGPSLKARAAKMFSASPPTKVQPSNFFVDNIETVRSRTLGATSTSAKLIYDKTENTLILQRITKNEKFSFITTTAVDYKIRARGSEKLTSIKPHDSLNISDPDTFKYVQKIQTNMSHTTFNAKNINKIQHPKAARLLQQIDDNRSIRHGTIDPNWRDYNSGGGVF